jgi:hypothetical protein
MQKIQWSEMTAVDIPGVRPIFNLLGLRRGSSNR